MENIIEMITNIVGVIVRFPLRVVNRIPFLYVMLYSLAVPVVAVCGIAYLVLLYCDLNNFTVGNDNTKHFSGTIYKTPAIAKTLKIVFNVASVYMMLCTALLFLAPLSDCSEGNMAGNIFWIVILLAAVLLMLAYQTNLCMYLPICSNMSRQKAYLYSGAAILISRMFFGTGGIDFMGFVAIWLFSGFVAKTKDSIQYKCYDTIKYFAEKDKEDTYVKKPAFPELLAEVKANIISMGDYQEDSIEDLNVASDIKVTRAMPDKLPMLECNNEEYLAYMTNLYEKRCTNTGNDYMGIARSLKDNSSDVLKRAKKNYSVNEYKPEAVEKVFEALGFMAEPTAENYVKFRKTAELLEKIYSAEYYNEKLNWNYTYDEKYKIISSGVIGEDITAETVQKMKKKYPDMRILKNFRFAYDNEGHSAECDLLILTTGGIFCIEVKNYGQDANYDIEIFDNGTWYKKYGTTMHEISGDPFRQNHMHAQALVQRFEKELAEVTEDGSIPQIHELVVVPNNITVINHSTNRVLHLDGLCEYIITEMRKYDMDKINILANTLAAKSKDALRTEKIDFAAWLKNIENLKTIREAYNEMNNGIALSEKYRII